MSRHQYQIKHHKPEICHQVLIQSIKEQENEESKSYCMRQGHTFKLIKLHYHKVSTNSIRKG